MDEILIGQSVAVQNTGGWTSWTEVSLGTAELGAGEHILRFYADDVYFNLDKLAFSIVTANTTSLLKRDNHALVFPNPFHSSLSVQPIEQGHLMHVEVFNAHGSKVFETQTLERVRIKEAKSWSPGVYFLKTTQGDDTKIRTIVKE
jgi:hypothetical protein